MRILSGVAQRLSQTVHGGTNAVLEFNDCVVRPKLFAYLFPCDDLLWVFEQENKYAKGLLGQPNNSFSVPA